MVDVTGSVAADLPVNIIVPIELKNIVIPLGQAFFAFGFGNLLARVLDDPSAACDMLRRKEASACNTGGPNPEQHLHGIFTCTPDGSRERLLHWHIVDDDAYCDTMSQKGRGWYLLFSIAFHAVDDSDRSLTIIHVPLLYQKGWFCEIKAGEVVIEGVRERISSK
jgi:hypothetical protein